MTPNSAYELVDIEKNVDYSPKINNQPTSTNDGPVVSKGMTPPVFALWCVESCNTGTVSIHPLGNENPIEVPCNAFKPGVVYYIYLKKLLNDNDGKVKFIGYRYKDNPMTY